MQHHLDEIIGHDEEWVQVEEGADEAEEEAAAQASATATVAASELAAAQQAAAEAAAIFEDTPPFKLSFEHPTYLCPTCGTTLNNIQYHGLSVMDSKTPT